jgi:hypothetical protein
MWAIAQALARGDDAFALRKIAARPELARCAFEGGATRAEAAPFFLVAIRHYVYVGDTLLHVAAAAYATKVVRALIDAGANVAATNRRGQHALHYAADGSPNMATWDPRVHAATVACLIAAGADPNAVDKSGVAPLHRAVRVRCTGAVRALLEGGADVRKKNKSGSLPRDLAEQTTGKSGSGTKASHEQQRAIQALIRDNGG